LPSGPRALITGIGGQDGSLLASLLVARGYKVVGTVLDPAEEVEGAETMVLDLADGTAVRGAVRDLAPHEIYHLASVSFVPSWWEDPVTHSGASAAAVAALLEATRTEAPEARFVFAASAEVFGAPEHEPQDERTPIQPLTPYGAAKAFGHFLTQSFRRTYGLHASSAILFNHESPRRPHHFLTRKVASGAVEIKLGLALELELGDLSAQRDWGWAEDYVAALALMARADDPDDFVVATGEAHTVEDFVAAAFDEVGLDWREHVRSVPSLVRPAESPALVGNPAKAREVLGWEPTVRFREIVARMVQAELQSATEA
jgi:GDPmannose 4,6-dehydratase